MFASIQYRLMIAVLVCPVLVCVVAGNLCQAEEPKGSKSSQAELKQAAEAVYRSAIRDYRSGETAGLAQIEAINDWSVRILLAESGLPNFADIGKVEHTKKALQRHIARAKALEELTLQMVRAGKAANHEAAAARYHRLFAEQLIAMSLASARSDQLSIELSPASEAVPLTAPSKPLRIVIRKDGSTYFNGKPIEPTVLEKTLKEFAAADVNGSVQIRADREVQFSHVAKIVSLCRKLRLSCVLSSADER